MTGYDIFLSNGDLLTTINVKTIDLQQNSSLNLIGQGIPDYGTDIAQNFVWVMENFSKSSAPVNPLVGQEWHNNVTDRLSYYGINGDWIPLLTPHTAFSTLLATTTNVDFATAQTVTIFTAPDTSKKYLPSTLVLVPNGTPSATGAPTINLSIINAGDVLSSLSVPLVVANQFVRLPTNEAPIMVTSSYTTVSLNITTAATGGSLRYDTYLFGLTI
jgi:hypothetical protein